jgi:hypothetical protein
MKESSHKHTAIFLHDQYIKLSPRQGNIILTETMLCRPTRFTCKHIGDYDSVFYISTQALKHMYDKKPSQEYDFVLHNMHTIVKYPDRIYYNKPGKRGDYLFRKALKTYDCLVCVEHDIENQRLSIVTGYFLRKESYLYNYKTLVSWEGGRSSIVQSN